MRLRLTRRLVFGSTALAALTILGASSASVPPSQVRVVSKENGGRIGPLLSCGYVGRIDVPATADAELDLERFREAAGRRGANTVVLQSDPEVRGGRAFLCPAPELAAEMGVRFSATSIQSYRTDPPPLIRYYPGETGVPATPRH